jgi:tetratricopeptide (TPR) repeat protein
VKLWPKQIGADYLVARLAREGERADAEALSDVLGGLPLAHEQAAAYCERLCVSLADYTGRFAAQPLKLLDAAKDAPPEYHDRQTVAKTFALAIEQAGKQHPAAEQLIVHAALLAPEPIPLFLFEDGREALGEPLASGLADDGLEEALAALRGFALVELEMVPDERDALAKTKCFLVHQLVRTVAAGRCEAAARELLTSRLIGMMAMTMKASGDATYSPSWPRLRRLDSAAEALIGSGVSGREDDTRVASICRQLADVRQFAFANYARAGQLYERALAIYEKEFGPDDLHTAECLNNFGLSLQAEGDISGARASFERALSIQEKALGPQHPETGTTMSNLGILLRALGDLAGARLLFERDLSICEKTLGPKHSNTARALNNLAVLLSDQGDCVAARPLFERALEIKLEALGPEHSDTTTSLYNLAGLLGARDDFAGARPLLEQALAIRKKVLGPEHILTLDAARAVVETLEALGRGDEAASVRQDYGV